MKLFRSVLVSTALALSSFGAYADTFNFSYAFNNANTGDGNPVVVTGSLTGSLVGSIVNSISNVQVALNGVAFAGPLIVRAFDPVSLNPSASITPVVSTNANLNNFIFADTDTTTNLNYNNIFWMQGGSVQALTFLQTDSLGNFKQGYETTVPGSWSLVAAPVPEPESFAMLLAGLALVGAIARRRTQA